MAPNPRVFLDTSALFASLISERGGARGIISLAEADRVTLVICQPVLLECSRALQKKAPHLLGALEDLVARLAIEVRPFPSAADVASATALIADPADAPILVAAQQAHVDYLVSLDRKHFLAPGVAEATALRIGTPGDCLLWLQIRLERA